MQDLVIKTGKGIAHRADKVFEIMEGKPYRWGGKNTNGFDCSGYVAYVFEQLFPERGTAFRTNVAGFMTSPLFEQVESPQSGDLIVFPEQLTGPYKGVNHIGIVQSQHGWVGSQSSTGVKFVMFSNGYWSKRPHYFLRYKYSSTQSIMSYMESMGR